MMHADSNNVVGSGVKYSSTPQHAKASEDINANGDIELNKVKQQKMNNSSKGHPPRDGNNTTKSTTGATSPNNPTSKTAKELTVLFTGEAEYSRRIRNGSLVRYLMVACILLFIACVIFIVIAFLPGSHFNSGEL